PAPAAPGAAAPVAPEGKVRIKPLRLVEEGREHFFLSFALAVPGVSRYHLFVGPKDYDLLLSFRLGLERLVNFGVFSWFAMPLFYALKFIDRYIGNFGWAIVILTALIRVLFFPLMHRSQVKMRQMQEKMKRVQPKLKALHYIAPVIMGVTMLVQQRMTASSIPDPAQRRMMYLMPIMFTYFFLNLPSGLVLYWLTSNLLGIGQQYLINRQVEAESRAA